LPWAYLGGVSADGAVALLSAVFASEPRRVDFVEELDPGITAWTWTLPDEEVRLQSIFDDSGDRLEVEAEGVFLGRDEGDWTNLKFGEWLVDQCDGAFAIVDDSQYCSTGGTDFVRVTTTRLELVRMVDDEASGTETIDESLTTLIALR